MELQQKCVVETVRSQGDMEAMVKEVAGDEPWVVPGRLARVAIIQAGGRPQACLVVQSLGDERVTVVQMRTEEFHVMVAAAMESLKAAEAARVGVLP